MKTKKEIAEYQKSYKKAYRLSERGRRSAAAYEKTRRAKTDKRVLAAMRKLNYAIECGRITKQPCEDCSARLNDCVQVQPQTDSDPGGFMSQWDYDADYSVRNAQAALAAWDRHNAPAPEQQALL